MSLLNTSNKIINEYILYNNETGSNSEITLSDSVVNYKYIEIEYCADNVYRTVKVSNANNKKVDLTIIFVWDNNHSIYSTTCTIQNNRILQQDAKNDVINSANAIISYGTARYVKIVKVVAYK